MALNTSLRMWSWRLSPAFVMYRLLKLDDGTGFRRGAIKQGLFSRSSRDAGVDREQHQPAVIFIAWPNNPTGNAFEQDSLEQIIKAAPGLVVIDEAYHAFAQKSMLPFLLEYDNVVLMRTLSKLGLAGLRLGMLFGASSWITEFDKLRLPYNIGTLNQLSAKFIIQNIDLLEQQAAKIRNNRESVLTGLDSIAGIETWLSEANFILFRVSGKNANDVHNELKEKNILIKNLHGTHPLLENCMRVTIGTDEENQAFLSALNSILLG